MGEVGSVRGGGTPSTTVLSYWDGDIPWCTPTEVVALETRFIESTSRAISEEGLANSSARLLPEGSVIVCTRATVGATAINVVPMATNQGFKSLTPTRDHDAEFLYYLLSSNEHTLQRYAAGSTFPELSKADFEKLSFSMPRLAEQVRIRHVLAESDDEIATLSAKLAALQTQKKGLMQRLLTGKVRVKV